MNLTLKCGTDVYKRQVLAVFFDSASKIVGMAQPSMAAVSYTHLDVYKRQGGFYGAF